MNMTVCNRERLLDAATEVFLEHGYDASVDMIIGRAGVARQTFYNHFQNKESLFAEVFRGCVFDILVPLSDRTGDVGESLKKFAEGYRQRVLSPNGIAWYRIMAGQAQRFPTLTNNAYALGVGQMLNGLADFLGKAMQEGRLRKDDPVFAAEMLISMLVGQERTRFLFGIPNPPEGKQTRAERVVDCFLRMFAPEHK